MTPAETAIMLAVAGTLDPRLRPPTPEDADARAMAWAAALDECMDSAWAQRAVIDHYRLSTDGLMPAHLNRAWADKRRRDAQEADAVRRRREVIAAEARAVPMPEDVRAKLFAMRETA